MICHRGIDILVLLWHLWCFEWLYAYRPYRKGTKMIKCNHMIANLGMGDQSLIVEVQTLGYQLLSDNLFDIADTFIPQLQAEILFCGLGRISYKERKSE